MPTMASVAIREELATARIENAVLTLAGRRGEDIPTINFQGKFDPMERQAVALEQIADLLESLIVVVQEPIVLDDVPFAEPFETVPESALKEEEANGEHHKDKRRPSPRLKT